MIIKENRIKENVIKDNGKKSQKAVYVDIRLLSAIATALEKVNGDVNKVFIKTQSRSSTIISDFLGMTIAVYNGKKYISVHITEEKIGRKLGEYSFTRTFKSHAKGGKVAKAAKGGKK